MTSPETVTTGPQLASEDSMPSPSFFARTSAPGFHPRTAAAGLETTSHHAHRSPSAGTRLEKDALERLVCGKGLLRPSAPVDKLCTLGHPPYPVKPNFDPNPTLGCSFKNVLSPLDADIMIALAFQMRGTWAAAATIVKDLLDGCRGTVGDRSATFPRGKGVQLHPVGVAMFRWARHG